MHYSVFVVNVCIFKLAFVIFMLLVFASPPRLLTRHSSLQEPPAFWVMFELSAGGNGSMAPLVELLPLTNLVALPSTPYGGPETEWEADDPKESCISWGRVGWEIYNMVLISLAGIDLFHSLPSSVLSSVCWLYRNPEMLIEAVWKMILTSAEERVGLDNLKPQSQFQQLPPLITRTIFSTTLMGGLGWWFGMSSRSPKLPENHQWTIGWHMLIWSAQHWIRFPLLD